MGWYGGYSSLKDAHREAFGDRANVLKSCSRAYGRRVWTLEQMTNGETFICLYLFESHKGDWSYKPISEDMGPYEKDCPVSYIQQATYKPEPGSYTANWRAAVLEAAAQNSRNKTFAQSLIIGDMLKSIRSGKTYRFLRMEKRSLIVTDGFTSYRMAQKDAIPTEATDHEDPRG